MARVWTLAEMRDRARSEADMINSKFVSNAEANNWVNSYLCEVYDTLVQAGPPDYYSSTYALNTSVGTLAYALPSDFRSIAVVYGVESNEYRRPIREINDYERARMRAPQAVYPVEIEYIPSPPVLYSDSDSFDGVSGWEELICLMTAKRMLAKEESDTSTIDMDIANMKARIRTASSQRGGPRYITDVNESDVWLFANVVRLRGCRIRGDNIELYEPIIPYGY